MTFRNFFANSCVFSPTRAALLTGCHGGKTIEAFRRGDWKLLQESPFAPLELYELKGDPQERVDLAKSNTQVFDELAAALRHQIQRARLVPWLGPER